MRSLTLTRMFAYFTLACYLVVGSAVVRFALPEMASFSLSSSYLNLLSNVSIKSSVHEEITAPEMKFAEIKIPVEREIKRAPKRIIVKKQVEKLPEMKVVAKNELPFHEPVKLEKIVMNTELPVNMVAIYKDFSFEETQVAEVKMQEDEVKTSMASTNEVEPEFFEYPVEAATAVDAKVADVKESKNEIETKTTEVEEQAVADLMQGPAKSEEAGQATAEISEPEFFDYPTEQAKEVAQAPVKADTQAQPESINVSNLVAFDYSKAQQEITTQKIPTVSKVSSQKPKNTPKPVQQDEQPLTPKEMNAFTADESSDKTMPVVKKSLAMTLVVQALGTDLKKLENLQNFEVRYQDNLSEISEDYGSGEIKIEAELSQSKMTRSIALLKRGYTPTSTEVVLEAGHGRVSIPLIEEEILNELQSAYESRGSIGALLVELDDETEVAKLDVPFGEVVKLNGDMKKTESEDFRYQLFLGVKAGNAMLSYHLRNGEVVSKIVHVHENEMTFDANYYEDVVNEKVRLYEEDLLAKENSPLIIAADQVRVFATDITAKKINNHTYKMGFGTSHLGGRRYLELNHQAEPVFVGIRDNNHVAVPSENFMRYILSNIEGARLANRCLIQVNLAKKAEKFEVASESVGTTLMTYTQVLDSDGKFYDSLSDKTRKIIIVGESHASGNVSPDSKINVKIEYTDGTVQFLNSYCSPNTYLVEQL